MWLNPLPIVDIRLVNLNVRKNWSGFAKGMARRVLSYFLALAA